MKLNLSFRALSFCVLVTSCFGSFAQEASAGSAPEFWKWAPAPPMGWNSYDAWGTSISEGETLANAQYMKDHLLAHGWKYIVIDARWYDAVSS